MLNLLRALRSGTLFSVVQLLLWLTIPGALHTDVSLAILHFLHLLHIKIITIATITAVQLLFCWHQGPPPERRPYIPKRRRRWKRLSQQFCQLLKSWTHKIRSLFTRTRISASDHLIRLQIKLNSKISSFRNSRRLHLRKLLAFKHRHKAFERPRVRFKKALYVFPLLCLTSLIINETSSQPSHDGIQDKAVFDTDSLDFGVDNRCSACISNVKEHFVGDLLKTDKVIKGYGGTRIHNVWQGTMKLPIEDDNGKVETFMIPHSYYVPDGDARLLSPQHWAKVMKSTQRPPKGVAPEQTFHDRVVLTWNKGHSIKTIPLDHVNVATFHLESGFNCFSLF